MNRRQTLKMLKEKKQSLMFSHIWKNFIKEHPLEHYLATLHAFHQLRKNNII